MRITGIVGLFTGGWLAEKKLIDTDKLKVQFLSCNANKSEKLMNGKTEATPIVGVKDGKLVLTQNVDQILEIWNSGINRETKLNLSLNSLEIQDKGGYYLLAATDGKTVSRMLIADEDELIKIAKADAMQKHQWKQSYEK